MLIEGKTLVYSDTAIILFRRVRTYFDTSFKWRKNSKSITNWILLLYIFCTPQELSKIYASDETIQDQVNTDGSL